MNHDVFISYSSKDNTAAQAICHCLEQNDIRCWIAPRDITPGTEYGDLIDEAIKQAKVVVVLFSERSVASPWVNGEMNIAFEEQKTIIPFRLDKTPLKGQSRVMLNQIHWIDAFPNYESKFSVLVEAVSLVLGRECNTVQKRKHNLGKKWIAYLCGALTAILFIIYIIAHLGEWFGAYNYDKNGLHVEVNGLTDEQCAALNTLLDNMVLVEGGVFEMGNVNVDSFAIQDCMTAQDKYSLPAHKVKLNNYYISRYELTQEEWKAFLPLGDKCIERGEKKAMDNLSWEDALFYASKLSEITGLKISLPTEAQWEYAARGGKKSKGYIFAGHNFDVTEIGWTSFDDLASAHEVGGKLANELGLFDMTGNVSEWCMDYYAPYPSTLQNNPCGPKQGGERVYRGGDYLSQDFFEMKTTTRFFAPPFVQRQATGMRLVINLKSE